MSTQIEINEDLIKYLQNLGYRKDTVVDKVREGDQGTRQCCSNANC